MNETAEQLRARILEDMHWALVEGRLDDVMKTLKALALVDPESARAVVNSIQSRIDRQDAM